MSSKANPTLIGAFVVGAVALAVAAVAILGGGRWLTPSNKFVMYFQGSVAGLQIGAPVDLPRHTPLTIRTASPSIFWRALLP